jgi:hypothetical protein
LIRENPDLDFALRELATSNRFLVAKFAELEQRVGDHDQAIRTLFDAIRQMMRQEVKDERRSRGFRVEEGGGTFL